MFTHHTYNFLFSKKQKNGFFVLDNACFLVPLPDRQFFYQQEHSHRSQCASFWRWANRRQDRTSRRNRSWAEARTLCRRRTLLPPRARVPRFPWRFTPTLRSALPASLPGRARPTSAVIPTRRPWSPSIWRLRVQAWRVSTVFLSGSLRFPLQVSFNFSSMWLPLAIFSFCFFSY